MGEETAQDEIGACGGRAMTRADFDSRARAMARALVDIHGLSPGGARAIARDALAADVAYAAARDLRRALVRGRRLPADVLEI